MFADGMPVATGGRMIQRTPNDPAWYKGPRSPPVVTSLDRFNCMLSATVG